MARPSLWWTVSWTIRTQAASVGPSGYVSKESRPGCAYHRLGCGIAGMSPFTISGLSRKLVNTLAEHRGLTSPHIVSKSLRAHLLPPHIRRVIPKRVRGAARSLPECFVPPKWRLPLQVEWLRLRRALEDEMVILNSLPLSYKTAVDIGANRGYYSYLMSKAFDRVEAFEPNPGVVQRLRDYNASNVHVNLLAVSSKPGEAILYIPIVNGVEYTGWASFDRANLGHCSTFRELDVTAITLDSLGLPDVSLIKIDVEGHEIDVLSGSRETIRTYRPVLIVETRPANRRAAASFFAELQYEAFLAEGRELRPLLEGIAGYGGSKENLILMPS
jgi:FkbM family methyltransferase